MQYFILVGGDQEGDIELNDEVSPKTIIYCVYIFALHSYRFLHSLICSITGTTDENS